MQNFSDSRFLDDKIKVIENITLRISKVLTFDYKPGNEYVQSLDTLYNERKNAIELLKTLMKSVETKGDKHLSDRIDRLIEKDKSNLDLLNKKVVEIRSKIRNLGKQRAVLLYTKD